MLPRTNVNRLTGHTLGQIQNQIQIQKSITGNKNFEPKIRIVVQSLNKGCEN